MARRLRRRAEPTSTDRIFAGAGAHGIYDDSALQTRYRDVNTACHHAAVDFDGNAEMYGRTRLGLLHIALHPEYQRRARTRAHKGGDRAK